MKRMPMKRAVVSVILGTSLLMTPTLSAAGELWAFIQNLVGQENECKVSVAFAELPEGSQWMVSPTDRTIRGALQRWSEASGWKLYWESPFDYPIIEQVVFPQRCFGDALQALLLEVSETGAGFRAVFYAGNRVLRIVPVRKL